MTVDDLDEDGAERPRLPRAVMDRRSRPLWRLLATSGATHSYWCKPKMMMMILAVVKDHRGFRKCEYMQASGPQIKQIITCLGGGLGGPNGSSYCYYLLTRWRCSSPVESADSRSAVSGTVGGTATVTVVSVSERSFTHTHTPIAFFYRHLSDQGFI